MKTKRFGFNSRKKQLFKENLLTFLVPFYGLDSLYSVLQSHYKETALQQQSFYQSWKDEKLS